MTPSQARKELFGAALDRFVAERDRLASALTQGGAVAEGRALRKLRRPSPSAWLTNQVTRRAPEAVRAFFAASDAFRDAQDAMLARKTDRAHFQAALHAVRAATAALGDAARDALSEHGRAVDVHLVERVLANFRAAGLSSAARNALLAGELERDLQAETDALSTLVGAGGDADSGGDDGEHEGGSDQGHVEAVRGKGDKRSKGGAVPANGAPRSAKEEAAERRRAERERALEAARELEARADGAARDAAAAATEAGAARDRARAHFEEQQRAADAAREALRGAEADLRRAETELARAQKAATQAREQRKRQEERG